MSPPTIDRGARDRLADLLERLLRQEIPVIKFEDAILDGNFRESADRGIAVIASAVDDIGEEGAALRDDVFAPPRFSDATIRNTKRYARFLRSDRPYEWPPYVPLHMRVRTTLMLWSVIGMAAFPLATLLAFDNGNGGLVLGYFNALGSWAMTYLLYRDSANEHSRLLRRLDFDRTVWPYCRSGDVSIHPAEGSELPTDPIPGSQPVE